MKESPPVPFSADEKEAAEQALKIYKRQVQEVDGLRWLFEHGPDDFQIVLDRIPEHHRELRRFEEAVREFGNLVNTLELFVDRPATSPGHTSRNTNVPPKGTYIITTAAINGFRHMHRALVAYTRALEEQGSRATAAAFLVACAVDPEVWLESGAPVPQDINLNYRANVADYLKAVAFA